MRMFRPLSVLLLAGCLAPPPTAEEESATAAKPINSDRWYGVNNINRVHYYIRDITEPTHMQAIVDSINAYNTITALDFQPGPVDSQGKPDLTDSEPHLLLVDFNNDASNTNTYNKLVSEAADDPTGTSAQLLAAYGSMLRAASGARHQDYIIRFKANKPFTTSATDGSHVPLHEIGHAIGLIHEQSRSDYATYVNLYACCIASGREQSFATDTTALTNLAPFDVSSIMMYGSTTGCATTGSSCTCYPVTAKTTWSNATTSVSGMSGINEPACSADPASPQTETGYYIDESPTFSAEDRNVIYQLYPKKLGTDEAGDQFGYAVASGDFDGDGYADVAVGAPNEQPGSGSNQTGSVYLYKGTMTGLMPWRRIDEPGSGTHDGDGFGKSVRAGDLDGDGKADLIVGAPGATVSGHPGAGAVYVFYGDIYGANNPVTLTGNSIGANDASDNANFGKTMVLGDFNGDGSKEIAIGAANSKKKVYVVKRSASGVFSQYCNPWTSASSNDQFGASLATGDIDGDGADELAIGAPELYWGNAPGHVYIARGQLGGVFDATTTVVSEPVSAPAANDQFGAAVAIGNFNPNTNQASLAVGAPGRSNGEGRVYRFSSGFNFGLSDGFSFKLADFGVSNTTTAFFGSVLKAGELDGQGGEELAVGVPNWSGGTGLVAIFRGKVSSGDNVLTPAVTRSDPGTHGAGAGSEFGNALGEGNVDNKGRRDLIVGQWMRSSGIGATWVLKGSSSVGNLPSWSASESSFTTFLSQGASGGSSLTLYRR